MEGDAFVALLLVCFCSVEAVYEDVSCTTNGDRCHLPFVHQNTVYKTCTTANYGGVPWCSLTANYDNDQQWGNCTECSDLICTSDDRGRKCHFPFVYKGRTYNKCTSIDYDNRLWCYLNTLDNQQDTKWADCTQCTVTCTKRADSESSSQFDVTCPPGCEATNNRLWGTDIYTSDSYICAAAIHAGVIESSGGQIRVYKSPTRNSFSGSTQNGITSKNFTQPAWSFQFTDPNSTKRSIPCRLGWHKFDGYCYQFQKGVYRKWKQANSYCKKKYNATLASIHSSKENRHVNWLAFDYQWIGLTDRRKESQFQWSDKSPVIYTNWLPRQPNPFLAQAEDCVVMISHRNARWNDVSCSHKLQFTCKAAPDSCTKRADSEGSSQFNVTCPPGCEATSDRLWGTAVYTSDSYICAAAIHAGVIENSGGLVNVYKRPGRNSYSGSTHSGLTSKNFGRWSSSFQFSDRNSSNNTVSTTSQPAAVPGTTAVCPDGACDNGGTCIMYGMEHFYCICPEGLVGRQCQIDDDECFYSLNRCDHSCINTFGSYGCECRNGYSLGEDQRTCYDIDECSDEQLNNCDHLCNNTDGSYTCSCRTGYKLLSDGATCEDIDYCRSNPCMNGAECLQVKGRYFCVCPAGFTGFRCEVELSIPCRLGWEKFDGYCYQFQKGVYRKWKQANSYCKKKYNATLASIHSRKENRHVNRLAFDYQWIGLTDRRKESQFQWSDESPVIYKNWLPHQPKPFLAQAEDCVVMISHRNARWNDVSCNYKLQFTCKATPGACHSPTAIPNAHIPNMQTRYSVGSIVKYACLPGFQHTGNAFSKCRADQRWSKARIKCSGACRAPPTISNARMIGSTRRGLFKSGSIVRYQCRDGFTLQGNLSSSLKCRSDGRWQLPRFTCEGDCGSLPVVPNARALTVRTRTALYVCNSGFTPFGLTILKCTGGRWQTPRFRCLKN